MADDALTAIIGVYVDAESVAPGLAEVDTAVDRMVQSANAKLEQLGAFTTLEGLQASASKSGVSLQALTEQASLATGQLRLLNEANEQASAQGVNLKVTGLADIEKLQAALRSTIEQQRAAAAESQYGAPGFRTTTSPRGGERLQYAGEYAAPAGVRQGTVSQESAAAITAEYQRSLAAATEVASQLSTQVFEMGRLEQLAERYATYQRQGVELGNQTIAQLDAQAQAARDLRREQGAAFGEDGSGMRLVNGDEPTPQAYVGDLYDSEGNFNRQQALAEAAALREHVAQQNYETDPQSNTRQAQLIEATARAEQTNSALTQQGALLEHINQLEAAGVELTRLEVAQRKEAIAQLRLEEASQRGVSPESASGQSLVLQRLQAQLKTSQEEVSAAGGGGGGGFFGGLRAGFAGDKNGGGAEEAGNQVAQVAKYTAYYQIFRLIEESLRSSIQETLEFERAVTNLQIQFGLSRDNARDLATQLGNIAAANGLAPSVGAQLGQQFAGVFSGEGSNTDLATQGATLGSQLAVVSGSKDISKNFADATAATRAFNLQGADTTRILDAATTAAEHFLGAADPTAILPGLAQIGDLAHAAGLSVEQTANLLGDIQSRTGETSDAAAGELRRILGREGNAAFQQTFSREGINTTLPFQEELTQLSAKYDTLSEKEKAFITGQFGGGRAGAAATAFLEDFAKDQDLANQSVSEGGAFQEAYAKKINDVMGLIKSLGGEFKNIAKDVGETGIFAPLGVALELLKPGLQTLDQLLQLFNKIPAPIREAALGIGELALGVKALGGLGAIGGGIAGGIARIPGIGGALTTGGAGVTTAVGAEGAAGLAASEAELTAATARIEAAEYQLAASLEALNAGVAGAAEALGAATEEMVAASGELAVVTERLALTETESGGTALSGLGKFAVGLALAGVVIDQFYEASKKQLDAIKASDALTVTGTSSDDLKNSASALANAAAKDRESSGGVIGGVTNFARSHLSGIGTALGLAGGPLGGFLGGLLPNGESTGDAAKRAQQQADLAATEAKRLDAANTAAATGGDIASTIDLSSNTGITQSFANLKAAGLDANQQLDALHERLTNFAQAAAGGAEVLARGQSLIISQQIANAATNKLQNYEQINVDARNGQAGAAANYLKNVDPAELNQTLADTANAYFTSQGLDQGGAISPAQVKELTAKEIEAVKKKLAEGGMSAADIDKLNGDINQAVLTSVKQRVADANALAGQKLTQDEIGQVLQDAPSLIQQAQQETGARASLSGDAQGGSLAGARAGLARAQQLYDDLKASGASDQDLQSLRDQIDQYQLAVQQALVQHIAGLGALAESTLSPYDKDGRIEQQISTLEQELAVSTDADQRTQLQTQINNAKSQLAQQQLADANSSLEVGLASNDATGQAMAKYQEAVNTYNAIVASGVTSGQDFNQAQVAVANAQQQAIDAQVEAMSAQATAGTNQNNPVAVDQTGINNLVLKLLNTNQFGADGQQTAAYSALVTQLQQAQLKIASDAEAQGEAIEKATSDQTNPMAQIDLQITQTIRRLQTIDVGDPGKTAQDLTTLTQLGIQRAQRVVDENQAIAAARLNPQDVIGADQQSVGNDYDALRLAGNDKVKQAQAEKQLRIDRQKEAQDLLDQANAEREAGVRVGDPLADAVAALASTRNQLQIDLKGSTKYWDDLKQLNQEKAALAQAEQDRARELQDLAGDTTDPVHEALVALQAARNKLAIDQKNKTGDLDADQLSVTNAQQAAQKAAFDQQLQAQQQMYQLHEESGAQYLQFLNTQDASLRKQLSGMKKGQEGYQQLVDELNQVDQAIQSANDQLQGQFNLGDINLPTVYDVRRSIAATASGQAVDASTVNNVTINGVDFQAVVNYLSSIIGKSSTTVATTGRKGT